MNQDTPIDRMETIQPYAMAPWGGKTESTRIIWRIVPWAYNPFVPLTAEI